MVYGWFIRCDLTRLHSLLSLQTLLCCKTIRSNTEVLTQSRYTTRFITRLLEFKHLKGGQLILLLMQLPVRHNLYRHKAITSLPFMNPNLVQLNQPNWTMNYAFNNTGHPGNQMVSCDSNSKP